MTEALDEGLVASSLAALPHWTGDTNALVRTVSLDDAQADLLVTSIAEVADAMQHTADVQRTQEQVRISLSTPSAGGVTVLDVAMASRIEDLVDRATGEDRERVPRAESVGAEDVSSSPLPAEAEVESLMGVESGQAGGLAVPLPSEDPGQPEPGVADQQERPTY